MIKIVLIFFSYLLILPCWPSSGGIPVEKKEIKKPKEAPSVKSLSVSEKKEKLRKIAQEKERERKRKLIEKKKKSLNNTEWEIEIIPLGGGRKTKDTVVFKEGKVSLKKLVDKGFPPTNYTLTIQENGSLIWETMQTSKSGKIVFIRGEITSDIKSMHGVISYPKASGSLDYSFRSIEKKVATPDLY
jgi:hypothetical protein